MKILFAAGCLNRQKNIPLKKHYHFLLREMILEQNSEYPEVQLLSYQSYFHLFEKLRTSLHDRPDILVLFIRPFPLHPVVRPFIRYKNERNKQKLALHPAISGSMFPDNLQSEFINTDTSSGIKTGAFHRMIALLNVLSGKLVGLDYWAVDHIGREILKLHTYCNTLNTRLIIAGPPLYPAKKHINDICIQISRHLVDICTQKNIPHVHLSKLMDNQGHAILEVDGKHLTLTGHQFLAESIYKIIGK